MYIKILIQCKHILNYSYIKIPYEAFLCGNVTLTCSPSPGNACLSWIQRSPLTPEIDENGQITKITKIWMQKTPVCAHRSEHLEELRELKNVILLNFLNASG